MGVDRSTGVEEVGRCGRDVESRWTSDLRLGLLLVTVSAVLLLWLVVGFVRDPAASWLERCAIGSALLGCALTWALGRPYRATLPALDRTPRQATVIGRNTYNTQLDGDGNRNPYDLVAVTLGIDGRTVDSEIADMIAAESIDRFVPGSTWQVHVFEEPLHDRPMHERVILTAVHDDVVREGYDLGGHTLRGVTGHGSLLLRRRFANDAPRRLSK